MLPQLGLQKMRWMLVTLGYCLAVWDATSEQMTTLMALNCIQSQHENEGDLHQPTGCWLLQHYVTANKCPVQYSTSSCTSTLTSPFSRASTTTSWPPALAAISAVLPSWRGRTKTVAHSEEWQEHLWTNTMSCDSKNIANTKKPRVTN